jgi:hypothetical protein
MVCLALTLTVAFARALFRSRLGLMVENLALRQQLAVFKRRHGRPRLRPADRVFWVFLRRAWRKWTNALIVVDPVLSKKSIPEFPDSSLRAKSLSTVPRRGDGWREPLRGERDACIGERPFNGAIAQDRGRNQTAHQIFGGHCSHAA